MYSLSNHPQDVKILSCIGGDQDQGSPFTCKTEAARWQTELKKCGCRSSWCASCWKILKKPLVKRMRSMNWCHVREVMVSVDRSLYSDGAEAFDDITLKRGLGNMVKDLQRTDGVKIVDWVRVIEWHEDGFPHWHILIETERGGRGGMIGYKKIKSRWRFGMWVTETYIKSEAHWNNLVGYFDKHGYFEKGEEYQGRLPKWGLERNKTIKRWQSMKRTHGERKQSNRMGSESMKNDSEWLGKEEKRKKQTYEVMLSQCGSESIISIDGPGWKGAFKISIPYDKLKEYFPWQYMEGKGLVIRFTEEGLNDFITVLEWLKEDCEGEKGGGSAHRGYEAEAA